MEEEPKLVTLVTNDAAIKESSDEAKMLTEGPFVKITSAEMFMELAKAASATKDHFDATIKPKVTLDRAKRIRKLRVDDGCTWRSVASHTHADWGADADWEPVSNQLAGIALCEAAAELLGEDARKKPWN